MERNGVSKSGDLQLLGSKVSSGSLCPGQRSRGGISKRSLCTMSLGAGLQALPAKGAGWGCYYSDPFAPRVCFPSSGESNNCFMTPKLKVQLISHILATTQSNSVSHSDTGTPVGSILEPPLFNNSEENKQQNRHHFMPYWWVKVEGPVRATDSLIRAQDWDRRRHAASPLHPELSISVATFTDSICALRGAPCPGPGLCPACK